MRMDEALEFFQNQISSTQNPKERKVYEWFLALLSEIRSKELPLHRLSVIEKRLEKVQAEVDSAETAGREMKGFKRFLARDLSFLPRNYYQTLGISIGLAIGAGLGLTWGIPFNMPMGLIFGMSIGSGIGLIGGLVWGRQMDKKAEEQNLVLYSL